MLEALVGVDPADPLTGLGKFLGSAPANYTRQLSRDALKASSPPPLHTCLLPEEVVEGILQHTRMLCTPVAANVCGEWCAQHQQGCASTAAWYPKA